MPLASAEAFQAVSDAWLRAALSDALDRPLVAVKAPVFSTMKIRPLPSLAIVAKTGFDRPDAMRKYIAPSPKPVIVSRMNVLTRALPPSR